MEFNKIAGAVLVTLLSMMVIAKIGNSLVPIYHPPRDKPGAVEEQRPPEKQEPEKPVAELLAAADPKAGATRVRNDCMSCHTWDKGGANKVGPNLYDVVGRKKGSHAGYAYSEGMKNAGGEWTYDDIFKFLANPSAMIKGTKMTYRLSSAERRADVIAYLRSLSDSPKPLPAVEKKPDAPQPKPDEKKTEEPPKPGEPPKAAEPPKPAPPPSEEKKN